MYELNSTMALGIDSEAIREYDREHETEKESLSSEAATTSDTSDTSSDSGKSSGQNLDDLVAYYDKLDAEIKTLGSDEVMEKWLDKLEKNALDQLKFVLNMRNLMNLQKEQVKAPMAVFLKQIERI